MSFSQILGAIEIGTGKTVVLVGEVTPDRALNILGHAEATTNGVHKGEVCDFRAACTSVHAAIVAAEKRANAQLGSVYLAITGGFLRGFPHHGMVSVADADNIVSQGDVDRAVEAAKAKLPPAGQIYIHHVRSGFRLDGKRVDDPVGMCGEQLEALYWHVLGDESKVSNQLQVINSFGGVEVRDLIQSGAASASILVTKEEKHAGVMVIDIGGGTTDWAVYQHGRLVMTGCLPVGGEHLTNDLSLGLRIPGVRAEQLKREVGRAVVDKDDAGSAVWIYGDLKIGDRQIPRAAINQILAARVEEIFSIVKRQVGPLLSRQDLPVGVILTGGTSRLAGITDVARRVLGVDVRPAEPPAWVTDPTLRQPEYSTVLGLLYYGLYNQPSEPRRPARTGFIDRMKELLRLA